MEHSSGIGVLDKAVSVLRAVAATPLGLADLCTATGLPRATAHRLAVGMEGHGLLGRDGGGRWVTGPLLAGLAATAPDPLLMAAAHVLPELRDLTGESVQLYRAEGPSRVCIAVAEPRSGLRDTVPLGSVLPMHAGSAAKVLTAWARPRAGGPPAAFSAPALAEVRRLGWAESVAEREPGVASVSAPVRDPAGAVIAAVSVSGPVDRIGKRPGREWAADLRTAAEKLTAEL
jgi:DNA-binding IclR family transcriptional regulator